MRVDSALYSGYSVPPHYDSLVAKLIVHAPSRAQAIARMQRALDEMVVDGIETTLPLHRRIMADPEFQSGDYTIHWLERFVAQPTPTSPTVSQLDRPNFPVGLRGRASASWSRGP